MTRTREQLEQLLLRSPFDQTARSQYADLLSEDGNDEASLEQFRLLIQQGDPTADLQLRAAECCRRLGIHDQARDHVEAARVCSDFDPLDPRAGARTEPPRLHVVDGGKHEATPCEVVTIAGTDRVRFSDVVGMHDLKKVLRLRIIEPFLKPGLFEKFKKRSGGGVLLYGPPGCGKTLIARAIATECNASFTAVGISDILNWWIGESERNLAAIFDKARSETPAVLFFDELDALAFSRSKARSEHTRTLVNEFLSQLDGMSGRNDKVLILAATNMPWDVDEAMKRPGRFDRLIFVPPPDQEARAEMLRFKLQGVPTEPFDADRLAERCANFSGADIDGLLELAKDAVLDEILSGGDERKLSQADLENAAEESLPSTVEWMKTARNLVKFGGGGKAYRDVEKHLRSVGLY